MARFDLILNDYTSEAMKDKNYQEYFCDNTISPEQLSEIMSAIRKVDKKKVIGIVFQPIEEKVASYLPLMFEAVKGYGDVSVICDPVSGNLKEGKTTIGRIMDTMQCFAATAADMNMRVAGITFEAMERDSSIAFLKENAMICLKEGLIPSQMHYVTEYYKQIDRDYFDDGLTF